VSEADIEDAVGTKAEPASNGTRSQPGTVTASSCDFKGPRGAVSVEARSYSDTVAAGIDFDNIRAKDSKSSQYRVVRGLGDRAYVSDNRIVVRSRDVRIVVTVEPAGTTETNTERARRRLAGGMIERLARLHPPAGSAMPDTRIPSFLEP
jgi:hypothetical protein